MPDGISTIADFYRIAQEKDFARQNQLRVLSINAGTGFNVEFEADDLIYVKVATLPTRTIATNPATFMGLNFNIPGTAVYEGSDNYTMTWFSDQNLDLWNKMQGWTREVFDDSDSTGNYLTPKASAKITLVSVNNELEAINKYSLIGVCPKNVSNLQYDISNNGEIQTFDSIFSYHFWTPENI